MKAGIKALEQLTASDTMKGKRKATGMGYPIPLAISWTLLKKIQCISKWMIYIFYFYSIKKQKYLLAFSFIITSSSHSSPANTRNAGSWLLFFSPWATFFIHIADRFLIIILPLKRWFFSPVVRVFISNRSLCQQFFFSRSLSPFPLLTIVHFTPLMFSSVRWGSSKDCGLHIPWQRKASEARRKKLYCFVVRAFAHKHCAQLMSSWFY